MCALFTFSTGCVHRSLTIRTEPPGAAIYVNDQLKGESPLSYDFMWYGWHRLTLRKDGFERLDDRRKLRAPIYLWIPLDLVMELLPLPIRDTRTWSYTLTPSAALPTPVPPALLTPTPPPASAPKATTPAKPREQAPVPPAAEAGPTPTEEQGDAAR